MNKWCNIKYLLAILLLNTWAFAVSFFNPVNPTGLPYHIIVNNIMINDLPVPAGTSIGVFDDILCVGDFIVDTTGQTNLDIVVWQGNPDYNLPGFTVGHPIIFKVWVECFGDWQLLTASATYSTGDGNFGADSYSAVDLIATSTITPSISTSPNSLDFGAIEINQTCTRTLTISNVGSARLYISQLISNNSCFYFDSYYGALEPDNSVDIVVTFQPNSANLIQGNLTIVSDDPLNSSKTINLIGQGILAPKATIQVIPSSLDFGSVEIGKTVTQILQIQNTGNQTLTITSVTSNNNWFVPRASNFIVEAGSSYPLSVDFTPNGEGTVGGYLQIQSNAANNANYQVDLIGYGFESYFDPVTPTGLPYIIVVDSATVDNISLHTGDQIAVFDGELCVGLTVFLGYPIQVTAWRSDPGNGLAGFTPGNPISFKVFINAWEQWVELIPQVTWKQGNGTFGDGEFAVARLQAYSGLEPLIDINISSLDFGSLQVGSQKTLTFNIGNKGKSNLTISDIVSNYNVFWANPTNFTVIPTASHQVAVTFQPSEALAYSKKLTMYSNDPTTPSIDVSLVGQGLPAPVRSIEVSSTPIIFTATKIGATANNSVTILNTGSATVTIADVQFTNSCFSTTVSSIEVAAGASYNLPIRFVPNIVGLMSGIMTIENDSRNNPTIIINLSGTGYEGFFQPVESTGLPYTIIIDRLNTNGLITPSLGDEIGIFDGDLCVGIGLFLSDSGIINLNSWQANDAQGLPGFQIGNPIKLHYFARRNGYISVFLINIDLIEGDGKFGTGSYTVLAASLGKEIYPPASPQNLLAVGENRKVILNWQCNTEPDMAYYRIYRGVQPTAISLIDSIQAGEEQIVNFENPTSGDSITYYYAVTAIDTSLNESNYSNLVSATPFSSRGWYVTKTGIDSIANGTLEFPFLTIQKAINKCKLGDSIIVYPGDYYENLSDLGRRLTIHGQNGCYQTKIKGHLSDTPVISLSGNSVVSGFTIEGSDNLGDESGILISAGTPLIHQNIIIKFEEGIVCSGNSRPMIKNNLFNNLDILIKCLEQSEPFIHNNTIVNGQTGIAIESHDARPQIVNNIIAFNTGQGGGISNLVTSPATIRYNNLWSNSTDYTGMSDLTGIDGNISSDPVFKDYENGDFHLMVGSSSINAGEPTFDYHFEPEPNGDRINLGWYGNTPEAEAGLLEFTSKIQTVISEDSIYNQPSGIPPDAGVSITYTGLILPSWLRIISDSGLIQGVPTNADVGFHPIKIAVSDDFSRHDSLAYTLEVVNSVPVFTTSPDTIALEDELYSYDAQASDEGQGEVEYVLLQPPSWLTIDPQKGLVTGIPNNDLVGPHEVKIRFNDGNGAEIKQDYILQVQNVNDAPELQPLPTVSGIEDQNVTVQYQDWLNYVSDVDNEVTDLTWQVLKSAHTQVTNLGNSAVIAPDKNWFGAENIQIVVKDFSLADTNLLTLVIQPVNDPPVWDLPNSIKVLSTDSLALPLPNFVSDIDDPPDRLTFSFNPTFQPDDYSLYLYLNQNNALVIKPDLNTELIHGLIYLTVSDTSNAVALDSFYLTIEDVTPPTFTIGIFQNPIASEHLDFYFFPSEKISQIDYVKIGNQDKVVTYLSEITPSPYFCHHRLIKSETYTVSISAIDMNENNGLINYDFSAGEIYADRTSILYSPDSIVTIIVPQSAIAQNRFVLCLTNAHEKLNLNNRGEVLLAKQVVEQGILSYNFINPTGTLNKYVKVQFHLNPDQLQADRTKIGILMITDGSWQYQTTYADKYYEKFWIYTNRLGEYQLGFEAPTSPITLPTEIHLAQNYPNPFNSITTIGFALPELSNTNFTANTKLVIYDILGREVVRLLNQPLSPGTYTVIWNGRNSYGVPVASGLYLYNLIYGHYYKSHKMVLIK